MKEIKISSVIFQLFILINVPVFFVAAMPTDNNEEIVVTAYPDTQKRFVDLNYVSPEVSGLLQRSNLNVQQIREQQEKLKNRNAAESERGLIIMSSSTDPSNISTNPTSRE